jgi:hypothetical protein
LKAEITTYRAERTLFKSDDVLAFIRYVWWWFIGYRGVSDNFYYPEYATRAELYKFVDEGINTITPY